MRTVKARPGEEVWQNTNRGKVWYMITDSRGRDRYMSVPGGQQFRITTSDRELNSGNIFDVKQDPFLNGTLLRIDERAEAEKPAEFDDEQALTDEALTALLTKSGNSFQAAVKKLNERNVRRLAAIIDAGAEATTAQAAFMADYVRKTYWPQGITETNREILEEKGLQPVQSY